MIRVQVGSSSFYCESAEEAVKVHRLLSDESNRRMVPVAQALVSALAKHSNGHSQHSFATTFVKTLAPHSGKQLSSDELAKIIGTRSVAGVGPKLAQIRKLLAREDVPLESYITKVVSDGGGPARWDIARVP
jgi:hypothetical protein